MFLYRKVSFFLKFHLYLFPTACLQLLAEKEGSLSSLISKSTEKEQQLRETREREQLARGEAEGLRYELRELEREVGNQSSEMSLLCEQLTEVCSGKYLMG